MFICACVAVTENGGGHGGRHVLDELAQGAVAGASQVDAGVPDERHEVAVVQRLAGLAPGDVYAGQSSNTHGAAKDELPASAD